MSANFDNIADEQTISATLLESYLNAAGEISRLARRRPQRHRVGSHLHEHAYVSQHPWDQLEGAPYGTRGGMVTNHIFPADGEYVVRDRLTSAATTRASRTWTSRWTASASRSSATRTASRATPTAAAACR